MHPLRKPSFSPFAPSADPNGARHPFPFLLARPEPCRTHRQKKTEAPELTPHAAPRPRPSHNASTVE
eukprot:779492-Pyramimonas_sp.AAC.1